jgi:hypothetical protein
MEREGYALLKCVRPPCPSFLIRRQSLLLEMLPPPYLLGAHSADGRSCLQSLLPRKVKGASSQHGISLIPFTGLCLQRGRQTDRQTDRHLLQHLVWNALPFRNALCFSQPACGQDMRREFLEPNLL